MSNQVILTKIQCLTRPSGMLPLMSHAKSNDKQGIAFWVFLGVSSLFLGFVTAQAIQHNPLYSDRDAYGISKYKFIHSCKEELHHPEKLHIDLQGQKLPLTAVVGQALTANETLAVHSKAHPKEIVASVHAANSALAMTMPVEVAAASGGHHRVLGAAVMNCQYNQSTRQVEVTLGLSG